MIANLRTSLLLTAVALFVTSANAQNFFLPANGDWITDANWTIGTQPDAGTDARINESREATITTGQTATARIIYIGDAHNSATTSNDGTISMDGGTLNVGSLRIGTDSDGAGGTAATTTTGIFNLTDGQVNAIGEGATQAVQIGSTNLRDDGSLTAVNGTLNMGDGTTMPSIDYSNARFEVGTGNGATAMFNFNSGTVTGANQNVIIGQGDERNVSTMNIGGMGGTASLITGAADLNWNDGDGTINMRDGSLIRVRSMNFSNGAANTSSLTIDPGAQLDIGQGMVSRLGTATLNHDGALNFTGEVFYVRTVDALNIAPEDGGSDTSFRIGTGPLVAQESASVGGGTNHIEVLGIANSESTGTTGHFSRDLRDLWVGGVGNWDTDTAWGVGIAPHGRAETGDRFPVFASTAGTISGADLATFTTSPDWSPVLATTFALNDVIALERTGAGFDLGPLRAGIANPTDIVTRDSGDLVIGRHAGSDAQQLSVIDGSLIVTAGNELVIGSAGSDFPGTGLAATVTQSGGTVTVPALRFGPATLTGGDFGGAYNLDGGTLTVSGDITETAASVTDAQLYIDGGTLNLLGDSITVQSFRTGDSLNSAGTYTLTSDQTLTNTGVFFVGNAGTGTFTAEAGSTMVLATDSNTSFISGEARTGDGTFTSNGATISSDGLIGNAESGTGRIILNNGTVWTNTTGAFNVATGDTVGGQDFGGTGTLTMNGDATIIQSGGNFETANFGTAAPIATRTDGTINLNDQATIIVGSNNFILGQQDNTIATLNMSVGSTLDITVTDLTGTVRGTAGAFNINAGDGFLNMSGGTINAGNWNLTSATEGSTLLTISGGDINLSGNLDFRDNGEDQLLLSGDAGLAIDGTFTMNNATSNGVKNELKITGSSVDLSVGGNFIADPDARITFTADAGGFSTIDVSNGSVGVNNLPLVIDATALGSALTNGDQILFDIGTTVNGAPYENLPEGATVATFPDGSSYTITYTGGDGNDIALLATGGGDDPDGDGIDTVLELAFDTDPNSAASGHAGLPTVSGNTLRFRQLDLPGYTYIVEESPDLGSPAPWTLVATVPTLAADQSDSGPNSSTYEITIPQHGGVTRSYVRVRVEEIVIAP